MKNWRIVRVTNKGTLYVAEMPFWTKKGAQEAANHLNDTFGALVKAVNDATGHNFFVTHVDKIPLLELALAQARESKNA